jgi:hypothetical protein
LDTGDSHAGTTVKVAVAVGVCEAVPDGLGVSVDVLVPEVVPVCDADWEPVGDALRGEEGTQREDSSVG